MKKIKLYLLTIIITITPVFSQSVIAQLKGQVGGMYSSFTGNFTYTSSSGVIQSGKIYYQYPNKLHLKMSGGGVVATNGRFLWIFSPKSMICLKQDAGGSSGGIMGMINGYEGKQRGSSFIFKGNGKRHYDEIVVTASKGILKSVRLKKGDSITNIAFSGIKIGAGIKKSLFNYKPPTSARVKENPLNQ